MEMKLIDEQFEGVLCNFESEYVKEYNEVMDSLRVLATTPRTHVNWILT